VAVDSLTPQSQKSPEQTIGKNFQKIYSLTETISSDSSLRVPGIHTVIINLHVIFSSKCTIVIVKGINIYLHMKDIN